MSEAEPGKWLLWQVRPWGLRMTVRVIGRYETQEAAVRVGVRLGRTLPKGAAMRYYVRPQGCHLPRDPARYAWAHRDGGAAAGGRAPARR
jgi:hypothetical protein